MCDENLLAGMKKMFRETLTFRKTSRKILDINVSAALQADWAIFLAYSLIMYLCTGFSQNVLAVQKWIHKWIHIVRSMARPRTVNKSTGTKKTESEIGLHHGIFQCRHLGEKLNTTL